MTSASVQLVALLSLRWQMVRGAGVRAGLVATAVLLCWLVQMAVTSRHHLAAAALATALDLAPAAFLGFAALAVIAPLTSGGGNEVVPPDQLVAFPVRPTTQFLGGLVLAPFNLVWVVQLLVLSAMTSYLTQDTSLARGALTTVTYVLLLTVLGQAFAWLVVGLRQTRTGRRTVEIVGLVVLLAVVVAVRSPGGLRARLVLPADAVTRALTAAGTERWAVTTGALIVLLVIGLTLGVRACGWALARPGDLGSQRHLRPVRRRSRQRGALRTLIAVDRASVWRAAPLRRGGLVLAMLPGLVAVAAAVPWNSLIVLPGLVAAGAGLLFGINTFCLDGSGALWLSSLPHKSSMTSRAKTLVLTETVLGAVVIAAVVGALRSPGRSTAAEAVAIVCAALACTAVVVAQCIRTSVRRPHRADLHGVRDAAAPPGALAFASVRLAVPTAGVGMLLATGATTGVWWLSPLLALPVLLLAGLSLSRTLRRYDDPVQRARVVQVVAAG